jgi:hypothetical protein
MSEIRFNRWSHQSGTGGIYQDSSGNIGIGTSVPTSVLDIRGGSIKIGNDLLTSSGVSTFTSGLNVTGGSVGIGTDNPISELMVENTTQSHITVKTSGSNMAKFGSKGNDVYIGGTAGAANIIFKRNIVSIDHPADSGTETVRITSSGNVGIGTDNPGDLLTLYGTDPTIKLQDSSGDAFSLIEADNTDEGSLRFRADPLSAGANTHIRFDTDGSERLRIASDNTIHMGSRDAELNSTVFGKAFVNIVGRDPINTGFAATSCYLQLGGTESDINGLYPIGFGYRANTSTHVPAYIAYKTINAGAAEYGDIIFGTRNVTTDTEPSERVRITSDGRVGIGTDNPFASSLTVHGGIKVHGYDYARAYTGSSHQPAAILDVLDPAQTGEGNSANMGWFSMGWSATARSGEVMHRNTSDRYYVPGESTALAYYIEAGTGEAGGICLDEDSVNVYGSSDSGATFRIIDKDSDIVVAEMQQSSWDWEVRGNVNSSSTDLSTISDRRLKIGITTESTVGILSSYSNLQLKSFIRIDSYDFIKNRYEDQEELREVGLIAQEVEEVFPDCVSTKTIFDRRSYSQVEEYLGYELDEIKRVKMGKIIFKSIEAIQELINENNQLKSQLSSLEARISALENP